MDLRPIECRLCSVAKRGPCVQCPTRRRRLIRSGRANLLLLLSFFLWLAGLVEVASAWLISPAAALGGPAHGVMSFQVDNGFAGGILTTLLASILALMGWMVLTVVRSDDRGDDHERRITLIEGHLGFGNPRPKEPPE